MQEILDEDEFSNLKEHIKGLFDWDKKFTLSLDQLRRIKAITDEGKI